MKSHVLRLYVVAVTLLVFFVLWAVIAARPWAAAASPPAVDPHVARLDRWQRQLKHEAKAVNRLLERRWSVYHRRLRRREALIRRLERRHARQVAAARSAQAQAGSSTTTYSATATGASTAPAARVVTLPPQVKVVNVAPAAAATSSGSSHP